MNFKKKKINAITVKRLLYTFLICVLPFTSICQTLDDLSDVKVEELSEDQIRSFISESNKLNIKSLLFKKG